jgi:outer membrane protein
MKMNTLRSLLVSVTEPRWPIAGALLLAWAATAASQTLREPTAPTVATVAAAGIVLPQPVGSAERGPVKRLSVEEALALALERNLSLQVARLGPRIQDLGVAQAHAAWRPTLSSSLTTRSQDTPANSILAGGQDKVSDDLVSTSFGLEHRLPWGGSYSVAWDSSRSTTTNVFTNFDPILRSNVTLAYVQPLVRNFRIDTARQQLQVSQKAREQADVELRQAIVTTTRAVRLAYWELAYAYASWEVQRQSLDLARESLRQNRARVEIGTMAPLDVIEAQAEVARNEEAVIVAEAAVRQAEDRLRALIFDPAEPDFWTIRLEPTDVPQFLARPLDVEAAVRAALDRRTDLVATRKALESTNVTLRYFHNQTLPEVNLQVTYGLAGLGGRQFEPLRSFPLPGQPRGIVGQRGFGSVLGDILANDFPTWSIGVTIGYPVGRSAAEANFARAALERTQTELRIRALELQVATEVREVARQVQTNLKRIEATRAARELAEQRLAAEQKKFAVGLSTNFLVFQAQRDLAAARNAELRALLDYNRSLVDFEAVQEVPLASGAAATSGPTPAAPASAPAIEASSLGAAATSAAAARAAAAGRPF